MTNDPASEFASSPPAWLAALGWSGRFEVLDVIGRGGMGQVWRARDHKSGQLVALKVIDPSRVGDEHILARLDTEAAALMRLRDAGGHPHVVTVLDFGITDTLACIVMEFISGQDIRTWCEAEPPGLAVRVALIAKAARGVGACHHHGIIHRDMKPSNILVRSATREPVVVDFSIAKMDGTLPLTLTNEALGTVVYMAPEQFEQSATPIAAAADVYGIGATLYELLTHVPPHLGSFAEVAARHRNETRPVRPSLLNPEVPADLECIVLKALAHRLADRYADGDALADDLERYLGGRPIKARPRSTMAWLARQARRRPVLTAAIAIALVSALLTVWGVRQARQERRINDLQQQISAALQHKTWSRATLQKTDDTLVRLEAASPRRAAEWRAAMLGDVVADMEAAIQKPLLKDDDVVWLNEAATWMQVRDKAQATRLQALIGQRGDRWEDVATLRAPFADLARLFSKNPPRVRGDVLLPALAQSIADGQAPSVVISDTLTSPVEVGLTLVPPPNRAFHHYALRFETLKVPVVAALYRARYAPAEAMAFFEGQTIDPDAAVFFLSVRSEAPIPVIIPDARLFDRPFKLNLRQETNRATCDIDGRWSLATEDVFAIAPGGARTLITTSWPQDLGIQDIVVRQRTTSLGSPLEPGDQLMAGRRFAEALRAYENLMGDPTVGTEAAFKMAVALARQNQTDAALLQWETIGSGPPGLWRDLSLFQLWRDAVTRKGITEAKPFLDRIPDVGALHPRFAKTLSDADRSRLAATYDRVAQGLNLLTNTTVAAHDAIRAFQILGVSAVQTANKLALAQHFNGLDEPACRLLHDGLAAGRSVLPGKDLAATLSALEQWCSLVPSESDARLSSALDAWSKSLAGNPSMHAILRIEQARVEARSGNLDKALSLAADVRRRDEIDPRYRTTASLIEGTLLRRMGIEARAQGAWREGIRIARTSTNRGTLHLFDRMALHAETHTWDAAIAADLLAGFVGRTQTGGAGAALQSLFARTFLADTALPAWLNAPHDDARLAELTAQRALVTASPRTVCRGIIALMLERHFLGAAFGPVPAAEDRARVRSTVEMLFDAMQSGGGDAASADFFSYMQAWSNPGRIPQLEALAARHPEPLVVRLRWLLAQRCLMQGQADPAKTLLRQIKDDPALDPAWHTAIARQL